MKTTQHREVLVALLRAGRRDLARAYTASLNPKRAVVAAGPDKNWNDGDRSAPKTPWGPAQSAYILDTGVAFFGTAGHGGLKIPAAKAKQMLSGAALKHGELWNGAYWYEEDVAISIPLYEVKKWRDAAQRKMGVKASEDQLKKSIDRWFPEYGKLKDTGFKVPETPKAGDTVVFNEEVDWGRSGFKMQKGDKAKVVKVTRTSLHLQPEKAPPGKLYGIGVDYVMKGKISKL